MNSPLPHPLVVFFFNSHLFALSPRSNLVPRAFPLKNGWEGKSPGDEVAHDLEQAIKSRQIRHYGFWG